jgi:hypothetical protein
MTAIEGGVLIAALSLFSVCFFIVLYFGDRWSSRRLEEKRMDLEHQQMLLQRIQAPEQAVAQHVMQVAPIEEPPRVEFDNDTSFFDALGINPLEDTLGVDPDNGVPR